jgi:hypothetical protein
MGLRLLHIGFLGGCSKTVGRGTYSIILLSTSVLDTLYQLKVGHLINLSKPNYFVTFKAMLGNGLLLESPLEVLRTPHRGPSHLNPRVVLVDIKSYLKVQIPLHMH